MIARYVALVNGATKPQLRKAIVLLVTIAQQEPSSISSILALRVRPAPLAQDLVRTLNAQMTQMVLSPRKVQLLVTSLSVQLSSMSARQVQEKECNAMRELTL